MPDRPTDGLAARKKERTRSQLVEAAGDLFYERGYHATTVDDIAAVVDVSPRTFFRYFRTKEDLVVALGRTSLDAFCDAVAHRPDSEPLLVAVQNAIDETLAEGWRDTDRVRSFLALLRDTPALRARWLEEAHHNRRALATAIAIRTDGNAASMRTLLVAGTIILAINHGLQWWEDHAGKTSPAASVHRAIAVLATPLLPD